MCKYDVYESKTETTEQNTFIFTHNPPFHFFSGSKQHVIYCNKPIMSSHWVEVISIAYYFISVSSYLHESIQAEVRVTTRCYDHNMFQIHMLCHRKGEGNIICLCWFNVFQASIKLLFLSQPFLSLTLITIILPLLTISVKLPIHIYHIHFSITPFTPSIKIEKKVKCNMLHCSIYWELVEIENEWQKTIFFAYAFFKSRNKILAMSSSLSF